MKEFIGTTLMLLQTQNRDTPNTTTPATSFDKPTENERVPGDTTTIVQDNMLMMMVTGGYVHSYKICVTSNHSCETRMTSDCIRIDRRRTVIRHSYET